MTETTRPKELFKANLNPHQESLELAERHETLLKMYMERGIKIARLRAELAELREAAEAYVDGLGNPKQSDFDVVEAVRKLRAALATEEGS